MTASDADDLGEAQARRLENVSEQLMGLLRQPDVAQRLRTAKGGAEWSVMQVLGHLVEMVPYWLGQCRVVIAAAEPPTTILPSGCSARLVAVFALPGTI